MAMENTMESDIARTLVFYDGGCPLCSREIRHYANLDRAGRIEWIDITRERELLEALHISFPQAMRRLHVLDRNGVVLDGVRAFMAIWFELPNYRVLAATAFRVRALNLLETACFHFAARRYGARCRAGECPDSAVD